MGGQLRKDILGFGRIFLVCFLLGNILIPDVASYVIKFFPSIKCKSPISWSAEKVDLDQEDGKESDTEKEKEGETEKDFFIEINHLTLAVSWASHYLSKYSYERGYPSQIFPISTPPPRGL